MRIPVRNPGTQRTRWRHVWCRSRAQGRAWASLEMFFCNDGISTICSAQQRAYVTSFAYNRDGAGCLFQAHSSRADLIQRSKRPFLYLHFMSGSAQSGDLPAKPVSGPMDPHRSTRSTLPSDEPIGRPVRQDGERDAGSDTNRGLNPWALGI